MGDAADDLNESIENGTSLVKNLKTDELFEIENIVLMYTNRYNDKTKYEIIE
jgi:hypothetical protein